MAFFIHQCAVGVALLVVYVAFALMCMGHAYESRWSEMLL